MLRHRSWRESLRFQINIKNTDIKFNQFVV